MGENEQGGMLRTVTVIGLIAIIAMVVIMAVVGMKGSLRTNTLMAKDAGKNLVALTDNSMSKSFTGFNYTQIVDHPDGSATLTLPSNGTNVYGIVFSGGGDDVHQSFQTLDKWQAEVDIKTTSPNGLAWFSDDKHETGLGIESSTASWTQNPAFSTTWQHYVATGSKGPMWGTFVVYLRNNSGGPINVDVKNVTLTRMG